MASIRKFSMIAVMAVILYGCGEKSTTGDASGKIQSVYVSHPQPAPGSVARQYTSSVEEGKSVNASFKTGGQITRLTVKEGDYVKKGQIIGYLDDSDYKLSLSQIEAQYSQLSSELDRLEEMYRRKNVAPNDYEKAKAGLRQMKAQLDLTRRQLAYTRLEAPSAGYIVEQYMEPGEMAGSGTPIFRILDNSSLETTVALPASVYSRKGSLKAATATSAVTGEKEIPLDVIGFVPDADNNSLFRLRLRIPSAYRQTLLPGMSLNVKLHFDDEADRYTHLVPSRSVFDHQGKEYVWVINPADSTLSMKEVALEGRPEERYSMVEGLDGSETIVAAGVHHLHAKQKVNVVDDISSLR